MLFAQAGNGPSGEEVALIVGIVLAVITFAASLALHILFLLTVKRAVEQCDPRSRTFEPGQVWLNLIPCFGGIWMFFTVSRTAQSLRREFDDRGIDVPGDFGQQLGISYAALSLAAAVSSLIPYLSPLVGIPAVICWIMYWVKIAKLGRDLREGESYREEHDEYRRRRRAEREEEQREARRREDDEDDRPERDRRYDD